MQLLVELDHGAAGAQVPGARAERRLLIRPAQLAVEPHDQLGRVVVEVAETWRRRTWTRRQATPFELVGKDGRAGTGANHGSMMRPCLSRVENIPKNPVVERDHRPELSVVAA
ncbi:hypothetical protein GCM10023340_04020 [Nocardioides marinquilinus]|uniref:Uncharacterized protein n=1 Tax=Nocardioides marinquilinus TaxID=1210400 RepID=A0ABP9P6T6_9ACTN